MRNSSKSTALIFLIGTLTTFLVLGLVAYLDSTQGTRTFGNYAKKVIPANAGVAGLTAGLGFSVSLKLMGRPVSGRFLWSVFGLGVISYVLLHVWGYQNASVALGNSEKPPFKDYIHGLATSITLKEKYATTRPEALGKWGYLCLTAELLCFAGCLVVTCFDLKGSPHCPECMRYQSLVGTYFHSSASEVAANKKLSKAGQVAETQACKDDLDDLAKRYEELIERTPPHDLRKLLQHFAVRNNVKALGWLEFKAYCCPTCAAQTLLITRFLLDITSKIDNHHHSAKKLSNIAISSPQSRYRQHVTFSLPA